jgi:Integrase core domain
VLFDKICRQNAITHRLTQPASPTTTGKIERFHLTLRRELLDGHQPFESVEAAQAGVDEFVEQYNADRPHQGLDPDRPVTPAEWFSAIPEERRKLLPVWVPPTLTAAATPVGGSAKDADEDGTANAETSQPAVEGWVGGPVEFDRVVPPSGNMQLAGKQFWLGPSRAGRVVRFWASVDLIHLLIGGVKIKTVRSHLTVNDLARLVVQGAATPARHRCHRSSTAPQSRSTGWFLVAARSVSAGRSCWPPKSWLAVRSGSTSNLTR